MVPHSRSAGLLLYRDRGEAGVEVLLVHMGGPFWAGKDKGAWSIPKGEFSDGEDPLEVARREFEEEIGIPPPAGEYRELGTVRQAGGKVVTAFAARAELELSGVNSNRVTIEWPRGSGRLLEIPEVDRAAWMPVAEARERLIRAQVELLDRLPPDG